MWNAAEAAERRKDARVEREYEVALPHELTHAQRVVLVQSFAHDLANRYWSGAPGRWWPVARCFLVGSSLGNPFARRVSLVLIQFGLGGGRFGVSVSAQFAYLHARDRTHRAR